jgi:hypothetical protein
MGLEKTVDGKKFNAQLHGIRVGSQNHSGLTRTKHGYERVTARLTERPPKELVFNFSSESESESEVGGEDVSLING